MYPEMALGCFYHLLMREPDRGDALDVHARATLSCHNSDTNYPLFRCQQLGRGKLLQFSKHCLDLEIDSLLSLLLMFVIGSPLGGCLNDFVHTVLVDVSQTCFRGIQLHQFHLWKTESTCIAQPSYYFGESEQEKEVKYVVRRQKVEADSMG